MKKLNNISEENKYNILLIITDQERNNEWIPKSVNLPGLKRLKCPVSVFLIMKKYFTDSKAESAVFVM